MAVRQRVLCLRCIQKMELRGWGQATGFIAAITSGYIYVPRWLAGVLPRLWLVSPLPSQGSWTKHVQRGGQSRRKVGARQDRLPARLLRRWLVLTQRQPTECLYCKPEAVTTAGGELHIPVVLSGMVERHTRSSIIFLNISSYTRRFRANGK